MFWNFNHAFKGIGKECTRKFIIQTRPPFSRFLLTQKFFSHWIIFRKKGTLGNWALIRIPFCQRRKKKLQPRKVSRISALKIFERNTWKEMSYVSIDYHWREKLSTPGLFLIMRNWATEFTRPLVPVFVSNYPFLPLPTPNPSDPTSTPNPQSPPISTLLQPHPRVLISNACPASAISLRLSIPRLFYEFSESSPVWKWKSFVLMKLCKATFFFFAESTTTLIQLNPLPTISTNKTF